MLLVHGGALVILYNHVCAEQEASQCGASAVCDFVLGVTEFLWTMRLGVRRYSIPVDEAIPVRSGKCVTNFDFVTRRPESVIWLVDAEFCLVQFKKER